MCMPQHSAFLEYFYRSVHKAYIIQRVCGTLNFPISCIEGRYIKACADMCQTLDIFMSVMRCSASNVWEQLFSFKESRASSLSKPLMDMLYLTKKAWNAINVFWMIHTHMEQGVRPQHIDEMTMKMVEIAIIHVLQVCNPSLQQHSTCMCLSVFCAAIGRGEHCKVALPVAQH